VSTCPFNIVEVDEDGNATDNRAPDFNLRGFAALPHALMHTAKHHVHPEDYHEWWSSVDKTETAKEQVVELHSFDIRLGPDISVTSECMQIELTEEVDHLYVCKVKR